LVFLIQKKYFGSVFRKCISEVYFGRRNSKEGILEKKFGRRNS